MVSEVQWNGCVRCRHCGASPAIDVDLVGHWGLLLFRVETTEEGPFCRDCGLATYREITVGSAWFGWWGVQSLFYNLGGFVVNARTRRHIAALPPPETAWGQRPMDPGKPLFRRVGALGFAIPFLAVLGIVYTVYLRDQVAVEESMQRVTAGQCVGPMTVGWFRDEVRWQKVACSDPAAAGRVLRKVVGSASDPADASDCAGLPTTLHAHTERDFVVCVGPRN
ncbi:hypothetical protein FNL39_10557 [Nocardia caishijiensis]|uniref:Uncharacterized protein n=1 Tax=Nocardia caishijiensis TaxID=184756 RepID=A0ABQ6YKV8_9NOCA|nr:hypothetical protein FNL39_10557 [Nocardia caishijiensis]